MPMPRSLACALLIVGACAQPQPPVAETSAPAPGSASALDDTLRVPLAGQAVSRDGALRVWYVQLVAESRCPADVTCVWEGDAAVLLRAAAGGHTISDTVHTRLEPRTIAVAGYTLSLVEVHPYPGVKPPRPSSVVVRAVR